MKYFTLSLLFFAINYCCAQKIAQGLHERTEEQISLQPIDEELLGTWESTVSNQFYTFTLTSDGKLTYLSDSMKALNQDPNIRWTERITRWTVYGDEFYLIYPLKDVNLWFFIRLGVYIKKDKMLYFSGGFSNSELLAKNLRKELINDKHPIPSIAELKRASQ